MAKRCSIEDMKLKPHNLYSTAYALQGCLSGRGFEFNEEISSTENKCNYSGDCLFKQDGECLVSRVSPTALNNPYRDSIEITRSLI